MKTSVVGNQNLKSEALALNNGDQKTQESTTGFVNNRQEAFAQKNLREIIQNTQTSKSYRQAAEIRLPDHL